MSAGVSASACPAIPTAGAAGTFWPYATGIRNADTSVTRISTELSFPSTILNIGCISFIVIGTSQFHRYRTGPSLLRRLLPDAEKVARADYAYENTGTLADLDRFVAAVLEDVT